MFRLLFTLAALGLGLAGSSRAASLRTTPYYPEHTRVLIVGRISSQPRNVLFAHEQKMQVSVGPRRMDYTLHLKHARITGPNGGVAQVSDLRDRWWIRAEGRVMDDPQRIQVARLQVFSKTRNTLRGTAYYQRGRPHGYVTLVAAARERYRRR